jgi:hypothetical protein
VRLAVRNPTSRRANNVIAVTTAWQRDMPAQQQSTPASNYLFTSLGVMQGCVSHDVETRIAFFLRASFAATVQPAFWARDYKRTPITVATPIWAKQQPEYATTGHSRNRFQ